MSSEKAKILIVEDDVSLLKILEHSLQRFGFEVVTATSGLEALSRLRTFQPDLIVTDQDMPGMTGLELLRDLRGQMNFTPVVFLSAYSDQELIISALRAGADDYILKPYRVEELIARLEVTLRKSKFSEELMEANRHLQELVQTDHLTGLYNMRSIYEKIVVELKRSRRTKRPMACIMFDIDNFKRVNDLNDHLFGSFVLREIGAIVKHSLRDVNFAARYGGDEFLIVVSEADAKGVRLYCEKLRREIADKVFDNGAHSMRLTASFGFVVVDPNSEKDAQTVVREADHKLYEAKQAGRNQTVG